jgi:hypothetical protein
METIESKPQMRRGVHCTRDYASTLFKGRGWERGAGQKDVRASHKELKMAKTGSM